MTDDAALKDASENLNRIGVNRPVAVRQIHVCSLSQIGPVLETTT